VSDDQQWNKDNEDRSIIVIRERPFMWAVYAAFFVGIAAITFGLMELFFGP